MTNQAILDKLAKADSPTIANVIELFEGQSAVAGYANGTIKAVYPDLPPVVGYAVTATFRSGYPTEKSAYGNIGSIVKTGESVPAPRIVVIQDLDEPSRAAVYGEIMVSCFQATGFEGLITNGYGRDYLQVKDLGFPCFTSSMIVAHGYCTILETNVPVNIGGLDVVTGDLLHADGNGVVKVPGNLAPHVAELIQPFLDSEQAIIDLARDPDTPFEMIQRELAAHISRQEDMIKDAAKRTS